jgi:hypothetical protein
MMMTAPDVIDWPRIQAALRRWSAALAVLVGYFAAANLLCGAGTGTCSEGTLAGLNLTGAAGLIAAGGGAILLLLRASPWLLLTPVVPFAGGTVLFFGFGPTVTFLASEATRTYQAWSVYAIRPDQVLMTNLLSCIGIASLILGLRVALPRHRIRPRPGPKVPLRLVALGFLAAGLPLTHLVIMPSIFGTSDFFVPGVLRNLRHLADLGFALAAFLAAQGNRRWQLLFWLLWPGHLLLVFPEFSKNTVVITILLPAIGAFIVHRSWRRLSLWLVAVAGLFMLLQNTNAVARWTLADAERYEEVLNLQERLAILMDLRLTDTNIEDYLPAAKIGVESWWLRLNFSGPQAAAMALHDSGQVGEFTQNPLIYVIPRFLWPNKPVMASPGMDFNRRVTGNADTETRVGATIFADGYWKLGWFGVVLFGGATGLIFGMIARLSMHQFARGQFLYLPAAMIGLNMGATGVTAFFQNAILSALPVYAGYSLLIFLVYRMRPRGRSGAPGWPPPPQLAPQLAPAGLR